MPASSQERWQFRKDPNSIQLDIGIVGAGIAGLAAAAALTRCGHRVEVFERSQTKNEVGAALGVSPNVFGVLHAIGLNEKRAKALIIKQTRIYDGPSLKEVHRSDWAHVPDQYGGEWYSMHRADYHNELRHLALSPPEGIAPAQVVYGKQVVSVDCVAGIIRFTDDTEVKKDVVIGADGVRSNVAKSVLGDSLPPVQMSGQSAFRCLVSAKTLYDNEVTRATFRELEYEPNIIVKIAKTSDRRLIFYPCRDGELFNFVGLHPTSVEALGDEGWHAKGNVDDFIRKYDTFHPILKEAFSHAEDLKLWKLQFRDPIPVWSKGKTVLIGDAAHPMLPHQAQAANMALEDVGTLVMLLTKLKTREQIPRRLQMVREIRGNRATAMQILSNSPQDSVPNEMEKKVKPYLEGMKMPTNSEEFANWIFGYDLLAAIEKGMKAEGRRAKLA